MVPYCNIFGRAWAELCKVNSVQQLGLNHESLKTQFAFHVLERQWRRTVLWNRCGSRKHYSTCFWFLAYKHILIPQLLKAKNKAISFTPLWLGPYLSYTWQLTLRDLCSEPGLLNLIAVGFPFCRTYISSDSQWHPLLAHSIHLTLDFRDRIAFCSFTSCLPC